tara:strand:+ start:142 stop:1860 length:1719 start_codon:yes stop_codon:yes gene_type:complete
MDLYDNEIERARALHKKGLINEAVEIYRGILGERPNHPEAHHLYGVALLQSEKPLQAENELRLALAEKQDDPNYFCNLANAVLMLGRDEDALDNFTSALAIEATHLLSLSGKGNVLLKMGQFVEAEKIFDEILKLEPDNIQSLNQLGIIYAQTGRPQMAIELFRQCTENSDASAQIFANLANVLESLNNIEESEIALKRSLELDPTLLAARSIRCRLLRRNGKFEEAKKELQLILQHEVPNHERAGIIFQLGQVLDRLEDSPAAFDAFSSANILLSKSPEFIQTDPKCYLNRVKANREWYNAERISRLSLSRENSDVSLVFFVGFPRSGTTLMDQILDAHSSIVATNENSPLRNVRRLLKEHSTDIKKLPYLLDELAQIDLEEIRDSYWEEANRCFTLSPGTVLVDKIPFYISELGCANILFPDAKIIVALRDPRDVCLSCFMQNFGASDATANFLDFKTTVQSYKKVMELWLYYRDILSVPYLEYRYEDLISNFPGTVSNILEFLELDWSKEIEGYRKNAQDRYIGTPSYADVTSKIYTRASGRWLRYQEILKSDVTGLAQLISQFGYSIK